MPYNYQLMAFMATLAAHYSVAEYRADVGHDILSELAQPLSMALASIDSFRAPGATRKEFVDTQLKGGTVNVNASELTDLGVREKGSTAADSVPGLVHAYFMESDKPLNKETVQGLINYLVLHGTLPEKFTAAGEPSGAYSSPISLAALVKILMVIDTRRLSVQETMNAAGNANVEELKRIFTAG
jgi:hypothetical protein